MLSNRVWSIFTFLEYCDELTQPVRLSAELHICSSPNFLLGVTTQLFSGNTLCNSGFMEDVMLAQDVQE